MRPRITKEQREEQIACKRYALEQRRLAIEQKRRNIGSRQNVVSSDNCHELFLSPNTLKLFGIPTVKIGVVNSGIGFNAEIKCSMFSACHYFNIVDNIAKFARPNYFKLLIDGEPNPITYAIPHVDFAISTKLDVCDAFPNKCEFVPAFAEFLVESKQEEGLTIQRVRSDITLRKFCFFAYSNQDESFEGVRVRKALYYKMQEMSKNRVSNLGKCYGGKAPEVPLIHLTNAARIRQFKFVIAIENARHRGYITEKLINPLIAGSIPIYWGAPNVTEIFNKDRLILVDDFPSLDDCINYVLSIENDVGALTKIVSAPIFACSQDSPMYKKYMSFLTGGELYMNLIRKNAFFAKHIPPRLVPGCDTWMVTFADGKVCIFDRIVKEANESNFFSRVLAYDPNTLMCGKKSFLKTHARWVMGNIRGYGYYMWKPMAILAALEQAKDGDIVIWSDAGNKINAKCKEDISSIYRNLIESQANMTLIVHQYKEYAYSKMDAILTILGQDHQTILTKYPDQLHSAIAFFRKTPGTIKFVEEWRDLMFNTHLIDESPSKAKDDKSFIENRWDQTIMSLLAKKYDFEKMIVLNRPDETNKTPPSWGPKFYPNRSINCLRIRK